MAKHPNYEFIVAFAEGEEVQFKYHTDSHWYPVEYLSELEEHEFFRIKPKTRMINGFEVPCAMDEEPDDDYYYPDVNATKFHGSTNFCSDWDVLQLQRGLCFSNKDDAIAVAKAMLGINPNS